VSNPPRTVPDSSEKLKTKTSQQGGAYTDIQRLSHEYNLFQSQTLNQSTPFHSYFSFKICFFRAGHGGPSRLPVAQAQAVHVWRRPRPRRLVIMIRVSGECAGHALQVECIRVSSAFGGRRRPPGAMPGARDLGALPATQTRIMMRGRPAAGASRGDRRIRPRRPVPCARRAT
jgi:hypothetical protein